MSRHGFDSKVETDRFPTRYTDRFPGGKRPDILTDPDPDPDTTQTAVDAASEPDPMRVAVSCAVIATPSRMLPTVGHRTWTPSPESEPVDGERGALVAPPSVAAYDSQIGQAAYKGGVSALTLPAALVRHIAGNPMLNGEVIRLDGAPHGTSLMDETRHGAHRCPNTSSLGNSGTAESEFAQPSTPGPASAAGHGPTWSLPGHLTTRAPWCAHRQSLRRCTDIFSPGIAHEA
ncbi:hypothetical protein SAMN04487981_14120 [Streptomyces sp. cf386]|uniref:hypothetical protein n=1 Tax=Streptomyces sp. cf386 TaxID=1761904 RepID=UPI0008845CF6|nr:hypothetical protein [Streptomyces sp. cf386]SDP79314.1 hypothetical protein SAMN04487981_14120 [Streptomyces sp. cf386]